MCLVYTYCTNYKVSSKILFAFYKFVSVPYIIGLFFLIFFKKRLQVLAFVRNIYFEKNIEKINCFGQNIFYFFCTVVAMINILPIAM